MADSTAQEQATADKDAAEAQGLESAAKIHEALAEHLPNLQPHQRRALITHIAQGAADAVANPALAKLGVKNPGAPQAIVIPNQPQQEPPTDSQIADSLGGDADSPTSPQAEGSPQVALDEEEDGPAQDALGQEEEQAGAEDAESDSTADAEESEDKEEQQDPAPLAEGEIAPNAPADPADKSQGPGDRTRYADGTASHLIEQKQLEDHAEALKDPVNLRMAERMQEITQNTTKQLQELNAKSAAMIDGQLARQREAADKWHALEKTPYTEKSTAWHIGAAIFEALNAFGSGLTHDSHNTAMEIINKGLDRDIQRQDAQRESAYKNYTAETSLLDQMKGIYKNQSTAVLATKAAMLDQVSRDAQAQMAQMAPQIRGLNAQAFVQKVMADRDKAYDKVQASVTKEQMEQHKQDRADVLAQAELKVKEAQAQHFREKAQQARIGGGSSRADKAFTEFTDKVQNFRGSAPIAAQADRVNKADSALELVHQYPDPNEMPQPQFVALVHDVLRVSSGGAPTEGGIHALMPDSFRSRFSALESKAENKPIGAELGGYVKQFQQYLEGAKKTSQAKVNDYQYNKYLGYKDRVSPEKMQEFLQDNPELAKTVAEKKAARERAKDEGTP